MSATGGRMVVIGVGNTYRRDDGVGPAVADRLRSQLPAEVEVVEQDGEPSRLIDVWEGATVAVVLDAVHTHDAPPGTIHRLDLSLAEMASGHLQVAGQRTSHGLGPGEAVRLAAAVGRLPQRLVVYGVEVDDVALGVGFSPPVAAVVETLAQRVLEELRGAAEGCERPGRSDGPASALPA